MSVGTYHSGVNGTCTINGTELSVISWRVNATNEIVKFTNSKTGLYPYREATFHDCSVSVVIDMDFAQDPFQTPLSIQIGTTLSSVNLYLHQTAPGAMNGLYWGFPSLIVSSTPQDLTVDGKIGTSFEAVINGPFTYP